MASSHDLKEVLKESLENRNVLAEIKARIRAEVFSALDDESEGKPPLSNDNVLVFELIREFLDFNKCKYTSSVLVAERGLSKTPLDRDFLRNELNIVEDAPAKSVPLLYSLISSYKEKHPGLGNMGQNNFSHSLHVAGNLRSAHSHEMDERADDGPAAFIVKDGQHLY